MATRGRAGGMALGGWDLMVRPSRWWWRAGSDRVDEGRQQALVGAAQRVPTAAPGLEADLEGERSAVCRFLAHGRPHPRPVWSTQIGMRACDGDARSASPTSELVAWDDEHEAKGGVCHVV